MKLRTVVGDITSPAIAGSVDAIGNAANSTLLGGGGVDGAIHRAGGPQILAACRRVRADQYPDGLPAGEAVATTAGRLPCRWVIHTVGPVYSPEQDRAATLRSCYTRSLQEAARIGARRVAFPLVSAGVYGWPKQDAIRQALDAIGACTAPVDEVLLVLFDPATKAVADEMLRSRSDARSDGDEPAPAIAPD